MGFHKPDGACYLAAAGPSDGGRPAPWWQRLPLWRGWAGWLLTGATLLLVLFYGGRALLADSRKAVHLVVYAFSTQEEVLTQGILPAFETAWEAETGRDLLVEAVFGPSGTLANQINLGAPADVALLSNEQHVTWLQVGRRVAATTRPVPVSHTLMAIAGRPGRLAAVREFADLAGSDLRLLHADPRSSGAGSWAVLAEYGSALQITGDPAAARSQLQAIWDRVRLLAPSARAVMVLFELGAGDAIITYEQDARLAQDRGVNLEIIVPTHTIRAQHVAVIVDTNVTRAERPAAEAFLQYLQSDPAREAFRRYHLRPGGGDEQGAAMGETFTVQDLGGWSLAQRQVVEEIWQREILPQLHLTSTLAVPGSDP